MQDIPHPKAETLAFLIYTSQSGDLEYDPAEVIAEYMAEYTDEEKLRVYAHIEDTVTSTDTLPAMVPKVSTALWKAHYTE